MPPKPVKERAKKVTPMTMRQADPWTTFFNEFVPWHKLPDFLGLVRLLRIRDILRKRNLFDTSHVALVEQPPPPDASVRHKDARTPDGTFNDLDNPRMGAIHTRFGRNVPLEHTIPDPEPALLTPSPRVVSRELMTRDTFKPATILNLLAAAWIQFEVHDWFSHGKNQKEDPFQIPLEPGDPWGGDVMEIRRTCPDPTRSPNSSDPIPTFLNHETQWWDASQVYGSTAEIMQTLRSGVDGKLTLTADNLLPVDPTTGTDLTGVTGNWWIGLSLLHTLFAREHNAICDKLREEHADWSDDDLFQKARLINSALIAKIHTVDWTPAILSHPTTAVGVASNWWGLAGEAKLKQRGRISDSDVISGIPGSETDHFGVPYSLTEEFVSVYRMHPLMPDDLVLRSAADHSVLRELQIPDVSERKSRAVLEEFSLADLFYSFGVVHPGAVMLHNYPRFMQRLEREAGPTLDLAAVDILRDRERGVPRYNQFRRLLHLDPVDSFEQLTDNEQWREEIRKVYNDDVDRVDLMVGLYAETPPEGCGFSDTAFRIFTLMAPRRLKSDRFLSEDYGPEIYTQAGIDWVENNNMSSILLRNFPELRPAMGHLDNAFEPWRAIGS
ncbi:MAG: peroxidase family protein [Bryobacterales bacterium]